MKNAEIYSSVVLVFRSERMENITKNIKMEVPVLKWSAGSVWNKMMKRNEDYVELNGKTADGQK